jgi:hypothetical protein
VIAALAVGPGVAGAAQSPNCGFVAFAPQSDNGAFGIVAHAATCHTARIVAGGSRSSRFRYGAPRYDALGFSCSGLGEQLGGHGKYVVRFRCLRANSLVSFLRG